MQERGITAVLNLRREHDDRKREICTDRYLYLPTTDNTPPSIEDLQRGVDFIGKELADGGAVYVHCGVGVGRAPTMVAAYLISQGMTPLQAWKHIRRIRPFIWPMRGQYLQIERYAEILREQGAELPTPKDEPSPVDLPEDLPVRETSPASTDR
jgi:protein-tyrosine phosphatase